MKNIFFIFFCLLFFSSCRYFDKDCKKDLPICDSISNDTVNTINSNLIIDTMVFSDISNKWKYEWNYFVSDEIKLNENIYIDSDTLYKNDVLKLCDNYYGLTKNQKISFWTLLVASIVKFESNFDPNCRFQEGASLDYVWSEGLMQLSYGDETRFTTIPLSTEKQNILDPETNLRSGVIILAKQLKTRKTIFPNSFYYWSVLTRKQNDIINFFQTKDDNCKNQ